MEAGWIAKKTKLHCESELKFPSYCLQGKQLNWDLNKDYISRHPKSYKQATGGKKKTKKQTDKNHHRRRKITVGPRLPCQWHIPVEGAATKQTRFPVHPMALGYGGPVSLQMAGAPLASPSTLNFLPLRHVPHLTAAHDRGISLLSGLLGTETLNLDLQRAHSLKCSVLASLSIWAPYSLYTALK